MGNAVNTVQDHHSLHLIVSPWQKHQHQPHLSWTLPPRWPDGSPRKLSSYRKPRSLSSLTSVCLQSSTHHRSTSLPTPLIEKLSSSRTPVSNSSSRPRVLPNVRPPRPISTRV